MLYKFNIYIYTACSNVYIDNQNQLKILFSVNTENNSGGLIHKYI